MRTERVKRLSVLVTMVHLILILVAPVTAEEDIIIRAMSDEMARAMEELHMPQAEKPYFIAYSAQDVNSAKVAASLGSLTISNSTKKRTVNVELRVGNYSLDNSNYFSSRRFRGSRTTNNGTITAPLDDDYLELRRGFWLATDAQYKKAIEDLSAKRADLQTRRRTYNIKDFSKETPTRIADTYTDVKFNINELEQLVREVSLPFKEVPEITSSSVYIETRNTYTRFLNSEGSLFKRFEPQFILTINAEAQAADGLILQDSIRFFGCSVSDLPQKKELLAQVHEIGLRLQKLRDAAYIEHYNGPVLFEGMAAGEIFAQAFAPNLVASRMPISEDSSFEIFLSHLVAQIDGGENLLEKIGRRVLPAFVSLIDDPLIKEYNGMKLVGSFKIDDDAVPSRETKLIERGILKTLLASRVPAKSIEQSTGSRRGFGPAPSNLILTTDKALTDAEMRQALLERVKMLDLDYGIVVRRVGSIGANTFLRTFATMAGAPQSVPANVLLEVYKVFPDGHEEPVKGMELNGLSQATFRDIVAVGNKPVVYNEQFMSKASSMFSMEMSAHSSDLPVVSYVIPSLLFEEITLTKAAGPFPSPPITESPLIRTSRRSTK
jgi:TldD protein